MAEVAHFFVSSGSKLWQRCHFFMAVVTNRAEINKEIHPHQLRHSYATHLLNNGAPIEVIQSLMGHEKSETTRIYAQLSGRLRKEYYQKYF